MYIQSQHNKISANSSGTIIYNLITQRGINHSLLIEEVFSYLPDIKLNAIESTSEKVVMQIVVIELLERGIILPEQHAENEVHYLSSLLPLKLPQKGFYNSKLTNIDNLSVSTEKAIIFLGIPSDAGSPKPGTRFGPELLREKSNDIVYGNGAVYSIKDKKPLLESLSLHDIGDLNVERISLDECHAKLTNVISKLPMNAIPIILGGDHSFTYPIVKSIYNKYQNLTLVQLDNHLDIQTWGDFDNASPKYLDPVVHSNFISWIKQDCPGIEILQMGVNNYHRLDTSINLHELTSYLSSVSSKITNIELISNEKSCFDKLLPSGRNVYLTIDVDVINFVDMPMTGYPAALGISLEKLFHIITLICANNNIVGIDIMEFGKSNNREDHRPMATYLNYLILEIVSIIQHSIMNAESGLEKIKTSSLTNPNY